MSLAIRDLLTLTYRSLAGNGVRSSLTMLGIFMGVLAVNATLQVGAISRTVIAQRLAQRDAPQITLIPRWVPGVGRSVSLQSEDLDYLQQRLNGWQAMSALRWAGSSPLMFQDRQATPSTMAVTNDFWETANKQLVAGRFFTSADTAEYRPVIIVDQFLVDELFDGADPVGQRVYVRQQPFTIVGVVETNLSDGAPPEGEIFITMAFYHALHGHQDIGSIKIRPEQLTELDTVSEQAEMLLQQRFPGNEFWVWNNIEDILEQQKTLRATARGLAAVGAIALLVGGIGIANIMIASVTERTSEIGLRRAIGATQAEIMTQFMLEAILLSVVAGGAAIITVHGLTSIVADRLNLPYQFNLQTAAIAISSALLVGGGASFGPALRASHLDPVKALRAE
jgi:putative ABC transport system permease protein